MAATQGIPMQLPMDESGQPIILLQSNASLKKRLRGIAALKSNILAAKSLAVTLKTSFGPKGMDKIIVGSDGEITVTNDGATILNKMQIEHQCAKLLVDLSKSQDNQMGDGTTGIVILAGALLDQAYHLLEKGLHPLRIAQGFDVACGAAIEKLESCAQKASNLGEFNEILVKSAMTALGSKVVSSRQRQLAEMSVKAVLAVADLQRNDVNFDLIKVEGKPGGRLEESCLIEGVVLDKDLSHSQMRKTTENASIAILTCPFEPPKPKTKHKLDIKDAESYRMLQKAEQDYFTQMVAKVKESGANFVICQWGFDDEANHLLMQNDLPSVRWVGGTELELIAIATGGRIVARFEELTKEKLGKAGIVKEVKMGTEGDSMIVIENCHNSHAVTLLIRGGNKMIVDEAERCIHDAICCVRNLVRDDRVVAGGGASEIAASIAVEAYADTVANVEQYAVRAFADSLLSIPEALADNCGLEPISVVMDAKKQQLETKSPYIGVDCMQMGTHDMFKQGIQESFAAKQHQIALATQVVKMILKIDDIIDPQEYE